MVRDLMDLLGFFLFLFFFFNLFSILLLFYYFLLLLFLLMIIFHAYILLDNLPFVSVSAFLLLLLNSFFICFVGSFLLMVRSADGDLLQTFKFGNDLTDQQLGTAFD
jgi:hypothetical protein